MARLRFPVAFGGRAVGAMARDEGETSESSVGIHCVGLFPDARWLFPPKTSFPDCPSPELSFHLPKIKQKLSIVMESIQGCLSEALLEVSLAR